MARLPFLPVIAAGRNFQPVYVRDLARAIAKAALEPSAFGGKTYEIGGPQVMSMIELHRAVLAITGQDPELVALPDFVRRACSRSSAGFPGAPLTRDQWLMLQRDNLPATGRARARSVRHHARRRSARSAMNGCAASAPAASFAGRRMHLTATSLTVPVLLIAHHPRHRRGRHRVHPGLLDRPFDPRHRAARLRRRQMGRVQRRHPAGRDPRHRRALLADLLGGARGAAARVRRCRGASSATSSIAFLPSAILGFLLINRIEVLLGNAEVVAFALILGGIAIIAIEKLVKPGEIVGVAEMPLQTVVGVGLIQCLSMVPGVSRSGATILGGLSLGVERRTAAEFSFFLAIPTMLGATTLELVKHRDTLMAGASGVGFGTVAVGFVVSFVVAIVVVKAFVHYISRHGFAPFGWYRIAVGAAALVWLLAR